MAIKGPLQVQSILLVIGLVSAASCSLAFSQSDLVMIFIKKGAHLDSLPSSLREKMIANLDHQASLLRQALGPTLPDLLT